MGRGSCCMCELVVPEDEEMCEHVTLCTVCAVKMTHAGLTYQCYECLKGQDHDDDSVRDYVRYYAGMTATIAFVAAIGIVLFAVGMRMREHAHIHAHLNDNMEVQWSHMTAFENIVERLQQQLRVTDSRLQDLESLWNLFFNKTTDY